MNIYSLFIVKLRLSSMTFLAGWDLIFFDFCILVVFFDFWRVFRAWPDVDMKNRLSGC
jgi:hypothetical protein